MGLNKLPVKFYLVLLGFTLVGCQTTGTSFNYEGKKLDNNSYNCDWENIDSGKYTFSEAIREKYIRNVVSSVPNSTDPQWSNKALFEPLKTEVFKFTSEDVKNDYYYTDGDPNTKLKLDTIELNNLPYQYQNSSFVKIITNTCKSYWLQRTQYINAMAMDIDPLDGELKGVKYYSDVLGKNNFFRMNVPKAKVSSDKFTAIKTTSSSYADGILLRVFSDLDSKSKPNSVQIYADVSFFDKWAHLETAFTDDSLSRKLTKIDTDVDCSSSSLLGGCNLTETIGIDLPFKYIENKKNGFEIKVQGTRSKVLKIKGYQVQQILEAFK